MPDQRLIDILPDCFNPSTFTMAEQDLLKMASAGNPLNCLEYETDKHNPEKLDPATADSWCNKRAIKAELLRWLCTDEEAKTILKRAGSLTITGAIISGNLNLSCVDIPFRLMLERCYTKGSVDFSDAKIRNIVLSGTYIAGPLNADRMVIGGNVCLDNGFEAEGEVRLLAAHIVEDLYCTGGKFRNKGGGALSADRIVTGGNVCLNNGFYANGEVRLPAAKIGGDLYCDNGEFNGRFILQDVDVKRSILCSGARMNNPGKEALNADRMVIGGNVCLDNGFKAEGEVRLLGAHIGGDLYCGNGEFRNKNGKALNTDGMVTEGMVCLDAGFKAEGEVRLLGVNIGGDLSCTGGKFRNKGGGALSADGMITGGNVRLDNGFEAEGEVRLLAAKIGVDLYCTGGFFMNDGGPALIVDSMVTMGDVWLNKYNELNREFYANGEVRLIAAKIGGDLYCIGGAFRNDGGDAINADRLVVRGTLILMPREVSGNLNLTHARVEVFLDSKKKWPPKGSLLIDGFEYDRLGPNMKTTKKAEERIEWLELQPLDNGFSPQPYGQLAMVLKEMGHENDARKVRIARIDALRKHGELRLRRPTLEELKKHWRKSFVESLLRPLWYLFLSCSSKYGWAPHRPIILMLVMIGFGTMMFHSANHAHYMVATKMNESASGAHPLQTFHSFIYSIDTFVPFVDLHQEKYWLPNAAKGWGGVLFCTYLWLHIALGWILTTLAAVSLSGLLRKE